MEENFQWKASLSPIFSNNFYEEEKNYLTNVSINFKENQKFKIQIKEEEIQNKIIENNTNIPSASKLEICKIKNMKIFCKKMKKNVNFLEAS